MSPLYYEKKGVRLMANVGDTLPHCTGTGTQENPYIYTTEEGFKEAIAVTESYIEAGESNLNFDANNGVITQVTFRCKYIDGKGTTIRNLFTQNSGTNLILFQSSSSGYAIEVDNMNFYNMYIATTSVWHYARFIYDAGSNYQGHTKFFKNCNFTGVYKGLPHADNQGLISCHMQNGSCYDTMAFKDCTFNLNFDTYTNVDQLKIFKGDSNYPIELSNCTICFSGKTLSTANYVVYLFQYAVMDSCVVTNKSTNPLYIASGDNPRVEMELVNSGRKYTTTYNYVKLYMNHGTYSGSKFNVNNSHVLVNKTRLGVDTFTGGIQMQETDTSADNYIYDADKLAAKGFMVGRVIE